MTKLRTFSTDDEVEKILSQLPHREASEFIRNSIREKSAKNMQCVILCGGVGSRLYPLSKDIPKSMIKINNKPFIEYQIELLKKNGIKDIVLCVGHLSEQIKNHLGDGRKFGVRLTYGDPKDAKYDTGGVIKAVEENLKKEFFILYGDSYLPVDFQEIMNIFHIFRKKGLMTVFKNFNKFDKSNVEIEDGMVLKYDKKNNEKMIYIDYGLSIFRKDVIKSMPVKFPLDDVFKQLIKEKQLASFVIKTPFQEIGSFEGLKRFEKFAEENQL
jgi:NDP-sugar pyrophosphorylase family protein